MMNTQALAALDKELGEALGWTNLRPIKFMGEPCGYGGLHPLKMAESALPTWTRQWEACGPLMVEFGCWPSSPSMSDSVRVREQLEYFDKHKDRDTAVRVAICRAVLAILKSEPDADEAAHG
jgi:hypothetical protein